MDCYGLLRVHFERHRNLKMDMAPGPPPPLKDIFKKKSEDRETPILAIATAPGRRLSSSWQVLGNACKTCSPIAWLGRPSMVHGSSSSCTTSNTYIQLPQLPQLPPVSRPCWEMFPLTDEDWKLESPRDWQLKSWYPVLNRAETRATHHLERWCHLSLLKEDCCWSFDCL